MSAIRCPHCGTPLGRNGEFNPTILLLELDADSLADLYFHELDELTCPACGQKTGIQPTVAALFTNPYTVWYVPGSLLDSDSEGRFREEMQGTVGQEVPLESIPSLNQLRWTIGRRLKARLVSEAIGLLKAEDYEAYIMEHWRQLPPHVLAAILLVLIAPVTGAGIEVKDAKTGDAVSKEALVDRFHFWQAVAWVALVSAWTQGHERGATFEDDLQEYIDAQTVSSKSLEIFAEMADWTLKQDDVSPHALYIQEAVRATLFAGTNQPNPQAELWAELFVGHEMARLMDEPELRITLEKTAILPKRAQLTVLYQPLWNAIARRVRRLLEETPGEDAYLANMESLRAICTKAGYPSLVSELLGGSVKMTALPEGAHEQLLEILVHAAEKADPNGDALSPQLMTPFVYSLVSAGRVEALEKLAAAFLKQMPPTHASQARVEAWLGSLLKEMRQPQRLLAIIGAKPRSWERDLAPEIAAPLWTERSNALRILGRYQEALTVAREIVAILSEDAPPDMIRTAQMNLAILLRETGEPGKALELLQALLTVVPPGEQRVEILHSTAVTLMKLGRIEEAIPYLQEANEGAGVFPGLNSTILLSSLIALLHQDEYEELLRRLDEIEETAYMSRNARLHHLGLRLQVMSHGSEFFSNKRVAKLLDDINLLLEQTSASGDKQYYIQALRLKAWWYELQKMPEAMETWSELFAKAEDMGQPQDAQTLLALARYMYLAGELRLGYGLLTQVPSVLAGDIGGVEDLSISLNSPLQLSQLLTQLIDVLFWSTDRDEPIAADIRLAAELSRDVAGRARLLRQHEDYASMLDYGLTPPILQQLAPANGTLAVVEWIVGSDSAARFVTLIRANGEVESVWLTLPELDEEYLTRQIRARLQNWRAGRPGDPFDVKEWQQLEHWLDQELSPWLEPGDHVVFIEETATVGLPWHVAAAPRWTSSYAAGWTTLLTLAQRPPRQHKPVLGMAFVPRHGERAETLRALQESAAQTRALATTVAHRLVTAEGGACDREEMQSLLEHSTIAKVLCHGISTSQDQVAWLVTDEDTLPPGDFAIAGQEINRNFRLGWRDLQQLSAAPEVVFSAACSSGQVKLAGLGERLGLFNAALFPAGSRTLVAPWWNIVPAEVLPIMDDMIARYLTGDGSLVRAWREACLAAQENGLPRWHAWALGIEGDWR